MTVSKTRRAASSIKTPAVLSTETTDVMLRGVEAIRKINDRAIQGVLARYATAAEKLKAPRQPMDLLVLPIDLMRSELEATTLYWEELGAAAMEMQAELLGCSSHLVDSDALMQATHALDAIPVLPSLLPARAAAGRS